MDDSLQDKRDVSGEEDSLHSIHNEPDDITKLKVEAFHLRLRCYNMDQQLINCKCETLNSDTTKAGSYNQRMELNRVVCAHQELILVKEKLVEENRLLKEKFGGLNEDFEKKMYSTESLQMKYNKLHEIVENNVSVPDTVRKIMKDNEDLIESNIERKMRIRRLEKKLADMNNSVMDDETQRRKSLTQTLTKMFKATNDTSFNNGSTVPKSCFHCDELKVYTDTLSETVIKMTVDLQSLNKTIDQQKIQISELENTTSTAEKEQIVKYKMIAKQCIRKYQEEKDSNEQMRKEFDELIEFYIKQQGQLQMELSNLKNKPSDVPTNVESTKIGHIEKKFAQKLSEVDRANADVSSMLKSFNTSESSVHDYLEVGQYSPQYKISADKVFNSSIRSDSESIYGDRNISLNNTVFCNTNKHDLSVNEAAANRVIVNLQQKVQELGEVVHGYMAMMKNDADQSLSKNDRSCMAMSAEDVLGSSNKDEEESLKRIYEEEKQHFEYLIEEKKATINELRHKVEELQQEANYNNEVHKEAIAKYHNKMLEKTKRISELEGTQKSQQNQLTELQNKLTESKNQLTECENRLTESKNQLTECKNRLTECKNRLTECEKRVTESENRLTESENRATESENRATESENRVTENQSLLTKQQKQIEEFTSEMDNLENDNYNLRECLLLANDNFNKKLAESEMVFRKLKSVIDGLSENFSVGTIDKAADSADSEYVMEMIVVLESCLKEKKTATEMTDNESTGSWNVTQDNCNVQRSIGQSVESVRSKENYFYTDSLKLQQPQMNVNVPLQSGAHLNDLTNVTDLYLEPLAEEPHKEIGGAERYKYITENPEKIQDEINYYYKKCLRLRKIAVEEHEINKNWKRKFATPIYQSLEDLTKKIEEFKRQLDMCKQCLVRSRQGLPETVVQELRELNML